MNDLLIALTALFLGIVMGSAGGYQFGWHLGFDEGHEAARRMNDG